MGEGVGWGGVWGGEGRGDLYIRVCLSGLCFNVTFDGIYFILYLFKSFQFEIEEHREALCPYDYLQITAGRKRLGILCGHKIPKKINSTVNYMLLQFRSDSSSNYKGFKIAFDTEGSVSTYCACFALLQNL